MSGPVDDAAALVLAAVDLTPEAERPPLLRSLLAYTAAALAVSEGNAEASETTYRLADALATRTSPGCALPPVPSRAPLATRFRAALAAFCHPGCKRI